MRRMMRWACGFGPLAVGVLSVLGSSVAAAGPFPNDNCSTPTAITGEGFFVFDNCGANTGPEGQNTFGCGQPAIYFDLWYCWTAPCTGVATVSTCGLTTADTKIAVYLNGCNCPAVGESPAYCDDNACGLQSEVRFDVVCGQQYLIQVGSAVDLCWQGEFSIRCEGEPCDTPPEVCDDCCGTAPRFTGFPGGVAVLTQQGSPGTNALEVIDISNQGTAPIGANWAAAPFYSNSNPTNWTRNELGSVFGVTLDAQGNIYVTHSSVYGDRQNTCSGTVFLGDALGSLSADTANPGGRPGAIYKVSTATGVASLLATLPNASDPVYAGLYGVSESYPGLGNICYDCATDNLYVSNHEDGRIYRLSTSGTKRSTFAHGSGTVASGGAADPNDPPGFVPLANSAGSARGQRVWAVRTHDGRLYYSVWREDNCAVNGRVDSTAGNEVWSIDLVDSGPSAGEFIAGTEQLEIDMAFFPFVGNGPSGSSNPISDISFSPDCCMLLAERSMVDDTISDAHESRMLEFCMDPAAGTGWAPSPRIFTPGYTGAPSSSAGGVDYDFDAVNAVVNVWATADAINVTPWVYGLVGLPFSGGSPGSGIWIDADQDTSGHDKWSLGDVEISCPVTCGSIEDVSIICVADEDGWSGCYDYTFTFTNTSGVDVYYVLIVDPYVQQHLIPVPVVANGATSGPITIRICPPVDTGDCYPLHIALADRFLEECCTIDRCIPLPDCYCMEFVHFDIQGPGGLDPYNYSVTFSIKNLTPDTIEHMFIVPEPAGAFGIVPNYIDLPTTTPGGTAGPYKIDIGTLTPGAEYCLRFSIHTQNLEECCSKVICFTAPDGGGFPSCIADLNMDAVLDFFDVQTFLSLFAAGNPRADFNDDGAFNFFDVQSFLNAFAEGCP